MPFVEGRDHRHRVHYVVNGGGVPLLMIHGTAADGGQWTDAVATLADRHAVICPDLRGSGQTVDSGGALEVASLADDMASVLQAAGLGPAHVLGHSLGAVIAGALAGRHPELVRSLTMHAGWVRSSTHLRALFDFQQALLAESPRRFAEHLVTCALSPAFLETRGDAGAAQIAALLAEGLAPGTARQLALDRVADITDELTHVRAPTLLIASDQDQIITADHHTALRGALVHAHDSTVQAGHGAPFEALDELLGVFTAFVAAQA